MSEFDGRTGNGVTVSVDITASPTQVWLIVEPVEDHVDWMADAVAIRFESEQERGVGTTFLCDTKIGPITLTDRMEITEWVPEHRMGVRHSGIVTGEGVFTLEPLAGGTRTRFTWTEALEFPWYFGGRLGEVVAGRFVLGPLWRRNLKRLKALIESP
jgi:polyketide cyclase/dehydrase/lipid transport protein